MKNSENKKAKDLDIGIELDDIVSDMDKVMKMIQNIDNLDASTISENADKITNDSKAINKEIQDKYNPIIQKLKNNLDSKK